MEKAVKVVVGWYPVVEPQQRRILLHNLWNQAGKPWIGMAYAFHLDTLHLVSHQKHPCDAWSCFLAISAGSGRAQEFDFAISLPGLWWWDPQRHPPTNQVRRSRMEEPKTEPTLSEAKHMVYSRSQAEKTELVVAPYESFEYTFCPVKIYAGQ